MREPSNEKDRYTVSVRQKGVIVGHLPKKISHMSTLLAEAREGKIDCRVTGSRKYSC